MALFSQTCRLALRARPSLPFGRLSCTPALSPRIPSIRIPARARFFTSPSAALHRNAKPYPHRPPNDYRPPRKPFLAFLDNIPQDTVFWGIIIANGIVFVMWYMSSERWRQLGDPTSYKWMLDNFTSSMRNLSEGRVWTLFTACFSHENVGHILFNGFTYYFMARPVLIILGSRQFILLYLGGGIISSIASILWSKLIKNRNTSSHGASAAIYSLVSFLACIAPKMTFSLYGIIPIPAWLAVAGIFTYDTYSAISDKRTKTDTAGHVAGLLTGIGYFLTRRYRIF